MTLRIAIIGAGGMGRAAAKALDNDPAWTLTAVADPSDEARQRMLKSYPTISLHAHAEEVFTDPSIDAVALTTLADLRPAMIRRALQTGSIFGLKNPSPPP